MRTRFTEPLVVFCLAYIGLILSLIPEHLKFPASWVLLLVIFMVIPWPGYAVQPDQRAWAATKAAERFFIAILGIVWLVGIMSTACLREFAPAYIEGASVKELRQTVAENNPDKHIFTYRAGGGLRPALYMGTPEPQRITLLPAAPIMTHSIRQFTDGLEQSSQYAYLFGIIIGSFVLYLVGQIHLRASKVDDTESQTK
jgi:hypothetical protein